jgi:hypothetical protein
MGGQLSITVYTQSYLTPGVWNTTTILNMFPVAWSTNKYINIVGDNITCSTSFSGAGTGLYFPFSFTLSSTMPALPTNNNHGLIYYNPYTFGSPYTYWFVNRDLVQAAIAGTTGAMARQIPLDVTKSFRFFAVGSANDSPQYPTAFVGFVKYNNPVTAGAWPTYFGGKQPNADPSASSTIAASYVNSMGADGTQFVLWCEQVGSTNLVLSIPSANPAGLASMISGSTCGATLFSSINFTGNLSQASGFLVSNIVSGSTYNLTVQFVTNGAAKTPLLFNSNGVNINTIMGTDYVTNPFCFVVGQSMNNVTPVTLTAGVTLTGTADIVDWGYQSLVP